MNAASPHLPNPAPIDAYGNGGFRFAGMSHRGSLMCLPHGIWASPVASAREIDETALALALNPATPEAMVDHFLIGTGRDFLSMPAPLREALRLVEKSSDEPTVLCSHGDVIADLLSHVEQSGVALEPELRFAKGSTWVLDVEAGAVVAGHYLPARA